MKSIILLSLLLSQVAFSQHAKNEVKNNTFKPPVVAENKQAKVRMQSGNKFNDKYASKYHYQNNNQSFTCESINGRRNHCNVNTKNGVNFIRQLSGSSCNFNWGYDQTGIWVTNGCRAEFSVNIGWDQPGAEGNIMVCDSHNYQRNYCPAFLGGRDVFLLRQNSNASCVNNWGYDRNGIWVTNGCRAEFVVEDRNYNFGNDILICSSRNLRFQSCPANTRGGVEFMRQLSRASCNGNWGYDQQGIWVTNGCRAKFRLLPNNNYGYGNNGYGNNSSNIISCSSRNHQRRLCPADTSDGVRLKRQKSRASCVGNWGYDRNGIWVTNGCRATFELYINRGYGNNNGYGNNQGQGHGNNSGYGNNNGYGNNQGHGNNGYGNQNNRIVCSSLNLNRSVCSIPVGSRVQLYRQLSRKSCTGRWGYNRREIWVTNGCRAEFSLY